MSNVRPDYVNFDPVNFIFVKILQPFSKTQFAGGLEARGIEGGDNGGYGLGVGCGTRIRNLILVFGSLFLNELDGCFFAKQFYKPRVFIVQS